jgi:hypothetical protein
MNMDLESVANTLDDATHTQLDLDTLSAHSVRGFRCLPDLGPSDCALLLTAIASRSMGSIDDKYVGAEEAWALIDEHKDLQRELATALKAATFKRIRNLSTNPDR